MSAPTANGKFRTRTASGKRHTPSLSRPAAPAQDQAAPD